MVASVSNFISEKSFAKNMKMALLCAERHLFFVKSSLLCKVNRFLPSNDEEFPEDSCEILNVLCTQASVIRFYGLSFLPFSVMCNSSVYAFNLEYFKLCAKIDQ